MLMIQTQPQHYELIFLIQADMTISTEAYCFINASNVNKLFGLAS